MDQVFRWMRSTIRRGLASRESVRDATGQRTCIHKIRPWDFEVTGTLSHFPLWTVEETYFFINIQRKAFPIVCDSLYNLKVAAERSGSAPLNCQVVRHFFLYSFIFSVCKNGTYDRQFWSMIHHGLRTTCSEIL